MLDFAKCFLQPAEAIQEVCSEVNHIGKTLEVALAMGFLHAALKKFPPMLRATHGRRFEAFAQRFCVAANSVDQCGDA